MVALIKSQATHADDAECRALFLAVIRQAIQEHDSDWILATYGDARKDFEFVCNLAGVEPDAVRRTFRAQGDVKFALPLKDWAFVSALWHGVPKTTAAKEAGYGSKAAANRLLNRKDIVRVLQRYRHEFEETDKIVA